MGKRIIQQARGKGGPRYRAPSHRFIAKPQHRKYDEKEKNSVTYGLVKNLIHCPAHTAPLALVDYENELYYVIAPEGLKVNQKIATGEKAEIVIGNTLPLKNIPEGTNIFNIEKNPGDLGKFVKTSGVSAKIGSKLQNKIVVILPSKKKKLFNPECRATIGVVAAGGRTEKPFVKAGRKYHAMKARNKLYPITSAGAMNATDHPFGSGRGGPTFGGRASSIAPKNAPPGRKVGILRPKRTGKRN